MSQDKCICPIRGHQEPDHHAVNCPFYWPLPPKRAIARTMKPPCDDEVELLVVVDGCTTSVWVSREWWEAATPEEWRSPMAAAVQRMESATVAALAGAPPLPDEHDPDEALANLGAAWSQLSAVIQQLGLDDDAGARAEELATLCMAKVHGE